MRSTSMRPQALTTRSISTQAPKRQRSYPDRRAGGRRLAEMLCIDPIHRDEVSHVREKHAGAHDIIKTLAGRLQNRRATTLPVAGSWATCPLKYRETIDLDRLGKRADRRREFGRDNC